ncbi:MAG: TatD family hydrolase [Candidatus Thermoplasmatota archaeon]
MIYFDNHLHLRRDGRFLEAIREFKQAGGTHCILCQYPNPQKVLREKNYRILYQDTLRMAEEIQQKIEITVFVTVGPYPVDYLILRDHIGREKTLEIMKKGMEDAAQLCREHKCIAIGEIGRPHFPVDAQTISDSNEIMISGMIQAKDAGVPVVLHTESTTPQLCKELVTIAQNIQFPVEKIVKHYAPPLITEQENYGLLPSVLASKKNIIEALKKGSRFLMETDYIDDPLRPGAVLSPKTVPNRTKNLLKQGIMTEQQAYEIHKNLPQKTYGIDLSE